jgi:T5SS/PEP-CTERM-associated repeat protein
MLSTTPVTRSLNRAVCTRSSRSWRGRSAPVALLLSAAACLPVHAANIPWTNTVGGNFNVTANWNSGAGPVPVAADVAQFNIANTYTVTFNLSPINSGLSVGGSNVSFRPDTVASRTYALTSATISGGSLTLAAPSAGTNTLGLNISNDLNVNSGRTLTVSSANDVTAGSFNLATNAAGTASASFSGPGSNFVVTGSSTLGLNGGAASLTLSNNAIGSFGALTTTNSGIATSGAAILVQSGADITAMGNLLLGLGSVAGQISNFTVTGAGSTATQTGSATTTIGSSANSSTILEVSSGGSFTTGTGLTTINPTGTLAISGGTLNLKGNLTVAGGSLLQIAGSVPVLNWDPSRTMTINSGGQVNLAQNFQAPEGAVINVTGTGSQFNVNSFPLSTGNATINISSGGSLSASGFTLGTGIGSVSNLTVDGIDSSIAIFTGTSHAIGIDGGTASAAFTNGAFASFPSASTLSVGRSLSTDGASGTLNVLSDSDLTIGSLIIANSNTNTANVTVSGAGSTITQLGASTLTLGAFGGTANTAQVNIITGGTFTTGSGTTSILSTGRISISGGTLNANSNITISGGTLAVTSGGVFSWAAARTLNINSGGTFGTGSFSAPASASIFVSNTGSQFNATGAMSINLGASMTIQSGADVTVSSLFDIGEEGSGTVVVDAPGSSLTVNTGSTSFIGTDGNGSLSIRNGATASYNGSLRLAGFSPVSQGTLNVESGGSLTVGPLLVGSNAGETSTATVNVIAGSITSHASASLTVGLASSIDPFDTVNISAGGSYTMGSGLTTINRSGRLNLNAGTYTTNGNLEVFAPITLTAGSTLTALPTSTINLNASGALNITDSSVTLGTLNLIGGTVSFVSGSLSYGGNLTVGIGGMLGSNLTLDPSRALSLTGTTTINPQRQLILSGGLLSTGNIVNNGTFNFSSGTLNLTGPAGLTIGTGGALGNVVSATTGKAFNITGLTTIASYGTLLLADGIFNATGGIANSGEIRFAGLVSVLSGGQITNNKLIRGDGRIDNNLINTATGELRADVGNTLLLTGATGTNAGRINLQGGTIQFTQPLINGPAGTVVGSGFLHADQGLTNAGKIQIGNASLYLGSGLANNGEVQISAGLSSLYGPVTNNNKITVSGGGTATFYDALVMSPSSTFQTSTNSTSVFFGPVTGTGSFTGPGVKIFEAGGPGSLLGAIATVSGTTRVGPGATVEAGSFHEASVLIEGTLLLTPNLNTAQNTSRTSFLQIDPSGLLELTDNNLLVDYSATSPISTLISYFTSGQMTASGDASGLPTYLAIAESSDLGLTEFNGIAVDDTTVIAKYTYVGDANLDGQVDALDYERIDLAIGNTGVFGTAQGDLNYDGTVDALDYEQIDLNIGNGVGSPLATVFIPEPSTLSLLAPALLLVRRRR